MPPAPLPGNEAERLAALRSYEILDSACEAAFDNIAKLAVMLTGCPIAFVSLVDAERQWCKARWGMETTSVPRELSFCSYAILDPHNTMVVPDTAADRRFQDNPLVSGENGLRFYAGAPLVNAEGAALGTLCVLDHTPRLMSEAQREALGRLAETVVTTLELRRAMNHARGAALTDALTGIANRRALLNAVERAIARQERQGEAFALIYLDLDGFKRVNDLHGHAAGDEVLCKVAATLLENLRIGDTAARLGGDEFAILLTGNEVDAATTADRIRTEVEACMAENNWQVTASVGAVSFHSPPTDVEAVLAAADELMYGAKFSGKNRVLHREFSPARSRHAA